MKTIDDKKVLKLAAEGNWQEVNRQLRFHLNDTNYFLDINDSFYNENESANQWDYDNQINNAMNLETDGALNTQGDRYDYLEFKIDEANRYVK